MTTMAVKTATGKQIGRTVNVTAWDQHELIGYIANAVKMGRTVLIVNATSTQIFKPSQETEVKS